VDRKKSGRTGGTSFRRGKVTKNEAVKKKLEGCLKGKKRKEAIRELRPAKFRKTP